MVLPTPTSSAINSRMGLGCLSAMISGTIWYDANANGTNDTGDSLLASANVYVDLNGDGVRQGNEPFATTDTNGVYQIVNIPSGTYAARVDTNSLPAGVRPTYDQDGTNTPNAVALTIANGQVITGLDFGYVGSGSISGFVRSDINGDGLYQTGEPGLVLAGRAYNIYDRGVNCDIPRKLRSLYGVNVLPMDFLPVEAEDIRDVNPNMYWNAGRRILGGRIPHSRS